MIHLHKHNPYFYAKKSAVKVVTVEADTPTVCVETAAYDYKFVFPNMEQAFAFSATFGEPPSNMWRPLKDVLPNTVNGPVCIGKRTLSDEWTFLAYTSTAFTRLTRVNLNDLCSVGYTHYCVLSPPPATERS